MKALVNSLEFSIRQHGFLLSFFFGVCFYLLVSEADWFFVSLFQSDCENDSTFGGVPLIPFLEEVTH